MGSDSVADNAGTASPDGAAAGVVSIFGVELAATAVVEAAGVGLGKDFSTSFHVLPLIAGMAYAVAHTRVAVSLATGSTPPSRSWKVAR